MTEKKKTQTKKINSRDKGARFERQLAKRLRDFGFEAERGCQHAGGKDSPDIKSNMAGIHIEAKNVEHLNVWSALEQSKRDAGEDEIPVVMFKRNRSDIYVTMPLDDFVDFYKAWIREKTDAKMQKQVQGCGEVPQIPKPMEE